MGSVFSPDIPEPETKVQPKPPPEEQKKPLKPAEAQGTKKRKKRGVKDLTIPLGGTEGSTSSGLGVPSNKKSNS